MSRKFFIVALLTGLLTSFTACGGGGGGEVAVDPPDGDPAVGFELKNSNASTREIDVIWVKPVGSDIWEPAGRIYIPDYYGGSQGGMAPGEVFIFPELIIREYVDAYGGGNPGTFFDIRIEDETGNFIIVPSQIGRAHV